MSKLGGDFWGDLGRSLRGEAKRWAEANAKDLAEIGKDEARVIFGALASGDALKAKLTLAADMSPDEWKAYRAGTTKALAGTANRRARLYRALADLGNRAARTIGAAVVGALGG